MPQWTGQKGTCPIVTVCAELFGQSSPWNNTQHRSNQALVSQPHPQPQSSCPKFGILAKIWKDAACFRVGFWVDLRRRRLLRKKQLSLPAFYPHPVIWRHDSFPSIADRPRCEDNRCRITRRIDGAAAHSGNPRRQVARIMMPGGELAMNVLWAPLPILLPPTWIYWVRATSAVFDAKPQTFRDGPGDAVSRKDRQGDCRAGRISVDIKHADMNKRFRFYGRD